MRHFSLFFLILCFFSRAFANAPIIPYLTSENDILSLGDETVDAYNGKFVQLDTDIEIQGTHPLEINRYYDGGHHFDGDVGYGVGFSFPIFLKFTETEKQNVFVEQRSGFEIVCTVIADKRDKNDKKKNLYYRGKVDPDFFKHGYTNSAEALLRGEPSLMAMQVEGDINQFIVTLGDGTKRYYSSFTHPAPQVFYRLTREDFPDGCHRHYSYMEKDTLNLKQVWTTNPADTLAFNAVNFSHHDTYVRVDASNGQQVFYHTHVKKGEAKNHSLLSYSSVKFYKELLEKVVGKHLPTCEYEALSRSHYTCTLFSTKKVSLPDGRFIRVSYDDHERVNKLWTPELDVPLYEFSYHPGHTTVTDANGGIQRFHYNNRHLIKHEEPHRLQQFIWDGKGQLTKQFLSDVNNTHVIEREYSYDSRGNIKETKVTGSIVISGSKETYAVQYHYTDDGKNLLACEQHPDGYAIGYAYVPNTNLMLQKKTVSNNQIVEREFYHNDENGIRVVTVIDDGSGLNLDDFSNVTYRKIIQIFPQLNPALPGMTLPAVIQESYQDPQTGVIHPLKRIERTYSHGDLLAEEKVFDAEGKYCYSLRYEYNDRRQLISQSDPLGYVTVYQYDDNGNKTYEEKVGSGRKVAYVYNKSNHLIGEYEHIDGKVFATTHGYDSVGNRKETTDQFGQKTRFAYDKAGREISLTDPLGHIVTKTYDVQGNITSQTDQDGYLTTTLYNLYNKPLEIHYPDGTEKRFIYNLYGYLIYEKERDGLQIFYDVDYKGRVTLAKTCSPEGVVLKAIQKVYKGPNLILEIDALGNQISHTYDPAGRLISTQQGEKTTRFEYDSLGRLSKTITPERVEVKEYDFLNHVTEERIEDFLGTVFQKITYAYDIYGNCISQKQYIDADTIAETKTTYNSKNQLTSTIDACGNPTVILYHYFDHLRKEIVDSLGRKKLEIYDALDRLKEVIISSKETLLSHYKLYYDGRGNQVLREDDVVCDGQVFGTFFVATAYDSMGQKTLEVEQNKKGTAYSYLFGRLQTLTNPDGVGLVHAYDHLGRLSKLKSTDGTIDYQYTYDLNDNLLLVEDLIHDTVTKRSYDAYNRQIYEKQATEFEITYNYDAADRLKEVSFQGNVINYEYNPLSLVSVKRYQNKQLLYQYNQTTDWRGKILNNQLPNMALVYSWDPMGRCLSIDSPFHKQNATFNPAGNLTHLAVADPLGPYEIIYTYDDLDQLTSESGPFVNQYTHDSLNNRRVKNQVLNDINDLNQVISDEKNQYTYDRNGRRLTRQDTSYIYDALGRLTSIKDKESIVYHHDPFGRLVERSIANTKEKYLYQFDTEIASFDNEQMTTFKALYGSHAPFALELEGKVYSPIRNHRGDICSLLADKVVATYRYNAFGEFSHQGSVTSPWLFSGQRYDADSGFYHYAKREYDPALGVWVTPDPSGYADGPNLYAYVKNNPLTYVDPYGLWREEIETARRAINVFEDTCNYLSDRGRDVKNTYRNTRDFGEGFARGFLDDTTMGISEHALGEYKFKTENQRRGYSLGQGTSFAASFAYGGGEVKSAMFLFGGAARGAKTMFNTVKSLGGGKAVSQVANKVKSISQSGLKAFTRSTATKKAAAETVKKTGRNTNHLTPHPEAIGAHSSFRRNSVRTTTYETYRPQTNPKNPNHWESVKRYDGNLEHPHSHYNKVTEQRIHTPHVHDPSTPGGIRIPTPAEIP